MDKIKKYINLDSEATTTTDSSINTVKSISAEFWKVDLHGTFNHKKFEIQFKDAREPLYHRGIANLLKKIDFLKLYIQLIEEDITEDEYEEELEKNGKIYAIDITTETTENELFNILDIAKEIPKKLTASEVSEIFGVDVSNPNLKVLTI